MGGLQTKYSRRDRVFQSLEGKGHLNLSCEVKAVDFHYLTSFNFMAVGRTLTCGLSSRQFYEWSRGPPFPPWTMHRGSLSTKSTCSRSSKV